MNIIDIIEQKKQGNKLSKEEINYFINGVTNKTIEKYQISALLMAIYFQSMDDEEIINLTMAMVNSGDVIDLKDIKIPTVDKHSTGGVGDKTSLVLSPLLATFNLAVAKMSGRGLGHTGGTLDKLESIKGFEIELDNKDFIKQVNEIGLAIVGQTQKLVPADKILYALRDVTATVDSIPLIAASIMSKKIASGAQTIILDVKYGRGAFMKTKEDAQILAEKLVIIGNGVGRKTIACISNMNQPLGFEIGNANEVLEAIDTLKGHGPADLTELCVKITQEFLLVTGLFDDPNLALDAINEKLQNGEAYNKFIEFVEYQGGSIQAIENLRKAKKTQKILATKTGYIFEMDAIKIGQAGMYLGAGRIVANDKIDHEVSVEIKYKIGDYVHEGDEIAIIYYNNKLNLDKAIILINEAIKISKTQVNSIPVIDHIIGGYNK